MADTFGNGETGALVRSKLNAFMGEWNGSYAGKAPPTGTVVGHSDTQTLSNKSLTAPIITGLMKVEAVRGTGEAKSANYSVVAGDNGKLLVATVSGITITLPTVATLCPNAGDLFRLDIRNASGANITITRATSSTLAAGEWATISAVNGQAMAVAKGASVVIS